MAVTVAWLGPAKCCQTGSFGSGKSVTVGVGLGGSVTDALADGLAEGDSVGNGDGLNTNGVSVTTTVGRVPRQAASSRQPRIPAALPAFVVI